jgi:thioredoxin
MKPGNAILSVVVALLGGFLWIIHDVDTESAAGPVTSGALGAALASSKPVLVEFYADWCGPCRMVGPQVERLAAELDGRAKVIRLNVDENHDLAQRYGVSGIPCFIAFKNGSETSRQVGGIPPELMRSMIGM